MKKWMKSLTILTALFSISALAAGPYPTQVLKNRFGEQSLQYVLGGSNQIDINFIVDHANGNGLGIRSLKGPAASVYMNTSATPAVGNPNPAAGYIVINLNAKYASYIGGYSGFVSPVSGTPINVTTGVSAGLAYIITSLGTTTAAGFQALGLPVGANAVVGASFVAPANATATGTGTIEVPAAAGSGCQVIDIIGDANQAVGDNVGAQVIARCLAATNSSTTTLVATAPADNTVIGMRFVMGALPSPLN